MTLYKIKKTLNHFTLGPGPSAHIAAESRWAATLTDSNIVLILVVSAGPARPRISRVGPRP